MEYIFDVLLAKISSECVRALQLRLIKIKSPILFYSLSFFVFLSDPFLPWCGRVSARAWSFPWWWWPWNNLFSLWCRSPLLCEWCLRWLFSLCWTESEDWVCALPAKTQDTINKVMMIFFMTLIFSLRQSIYVLYSLWVSIFCKVTVTSFLTYPYIKQVKSEI